LVCGKTSRISGGFTGNPLALVSSTRALSFPGWYYGAPPNLIWENTCRSSKASSRPPQPATWQGALRRFRQAYAQRHLLRLRGRPLLQHARRLSRIIRQRTVSPGNGGESELLARRRKTRITKIWTIGHLGLTGAEENDLVAFLETLTDGFVQTSSLKARRPAH